jgi:hypothetical protein
MIMESTQFLRVPGNRASVRTVSQWVLAEIAPDELEASVGFIDSLIDMAAEGEVVTVDVYDKAGSFGGADLMVMVVVPVVITALGELLAKLGEAGIDGLKRKLRREKEAETLVAISVDDVEVVVSRIGPPGSKRRTKKLAKAVNKALIEYLAR